MAEMYYLEFSACWDMTVELYSDRVFNIKKHILTWILGQPEPVMSLIEDAKWEENKVEIVMADTTDA